MKKSDYFYKSKGKNNNCVNSHYNFESCQKCVELWKLEEEKVSDKIRNAQSKKDEEILPFNIGK